MKKSQLRIRFNGMSFTTHRQSRNAEVQKLVWPPCPRGWLGLVRKKGGPPVPDPGKGVCADPVNRGAILEGGGPGPPGGNKEGQLSPDRGRGKRDKMRRWQEVKEDYPFMASRCEHAQSKLTCIAREEMCEYVGDIVFVYLLYLLFQENKSFGANTICIHPLM